eukprot:gene12704-6902_t
MSVDEAIYKENINKLEELIKKGFKIDKQYPYPLGCNQSYGDSIPWTPLQYAAAIGKQSVIDFLIENGADISIKDKTGRTAQEIGDNLKRNIDVLSSVKKKERKEKERKENERKEKERKENERKEKERKEKERKEKERKENERREKERKEFFLKPLEFFQNSNKSFKENQEIFNEFQKIFQSYLKNEIKDEILDEILLKKIEKTKNPKIISKLNNNSWLRVNYENDFLEKIEKLKKNPATSEELKQMKKVIRRKLEEYEDENPEKEEKLLQLVFKDLFQEWVNQKSKFMDLFDEMINFKSNSEVELKFEIMKEIKSGKIQDGDIFFEIERCFKILGNYFNNSENNHGMKLFISNHFYQEEIGVLKEENDVLKEKIESMEQKIQELESLLLTDKKMEFVPHDAVFIE